ncbi:Stk1 family PASTA domain-containing Ser/Thr kinase [Shouchella lonarensis]|uniref:Serine/threonine-protein kinase PrkC n=1 Tax=Shouchella lonarensis TaxID=1464122 RepID=A0A1G6L9I3_9BACI|nr:Stk1 family PASTA domain-containing Ser/Thr kinase [Shouchella lonarensis]SDC39783.1 serine/threonine protein kinase [Shouchella lonarensis]
MIGERIGGRYVVLENIGGGGMANVYMALDVILDRHVAVKVLQPQFSEDEQFIRRFRREAEAATSLAHPNVVNVYDVGEEDHLYYIVMEYVKGRTLKQVIAEEGPLPIPVALDYFKQMLQGIHHAHTMQIVHRDVKPQNILISEDGIAKVTDFGIARAIDSATITHTNAVMGSVHYLSPEQARGGHITCRSDLYSLGIVLFEMVTGEIPFSGDTAVSIAIKHLQNELPSVRELVPTIPQSVEKMIQKATNKDPDQRYHSATEMIAACDVALSPDVAPIMSYANEPSTDKDDQATRVLPVVTEDQKDEAAREVTSGGESEKTSSGKKTKKKRRKWPWIVAGLLALVFTAFILALTVLPSLLAVGEVRVADVTNMPLEEATEKLESLKLKVESEYMASDEVDPNHVVKQNPVADRLVKEGSTVTLFVSAPQDELSLDDYKDLSVSQATRLIEQLGMKVETIAQEYDDQKENTVLSQNPAPGTKVIPAETTIVLTYSVPTAVRLDDLTGWSEEDVQKYLDDVGLRGRFTHEPDDRVAAGGVIRQSPDPRSTLQKGDNVNVVFSTGKESSNSDQPNLPKDEAEAPERENPGEAGDDAEPSMVYLVKQTVEVSEAHRSEGRTFDVRIVSQDATSQGDEKVVVEETIDETKTFEIPLRVSPSYKGSFAVYIDGELARQSVVREYKE